MNEYHKIETLYVRDLNTFKVNPYILKNPVYGIIKSWVWTEKVDGTNIRVIWDGAKVHFGGKTDNAQIPADLVSYLADTFPADKLSAVFAAQGAVLYGEGYGPGIQNGGNLAESKKFILFDVRVGEWWLNDENMRDVAAKLGIEAVPLYGEMTLEEATGFVSAGFKSKLNGAKAQAEGLVGRPIETLFDKKGARLIVKLKTKDFA